MLRVGYWTGSRSLSTQVLKHTFPPYWSSQTFPAMWTKQRQASSYCSTRKRDILFTQTQP